MSFELFSVKYYQENEERLQKKNHERYQNLSKEKKKKISNNMVVNVTNLPQDLSSL